jgi:hypothetical protein
VSAFPNGQFYPHLQPQTTSRLDFNGKTGQGLFDSGYGLDFQRSDRANLGNVSRVHNGDCIVRAKSHVRLDDALYPAELFNRLLDFTRTDFDQHVCFHRYSFSFAPKEQLTNSSRQDRAAYS